MHFRAWRDARDQQHGRIRDYRAGPRLVARCGGNAKLLAKSAPAFTAEFLQDAATGRPAIPGRRRRAHRWKPRARDQGAILDG